MVASYEEIPNETGEYQMQPTYLYSIAGVSFYEHPTYGDEHPLLVKHNGKFISSTYYDPDHSDALEVKAMLKEKGNK